MKHIRSCVFVAMGILAATAGAQSLTTTFASGNGGSSLWTNYWDITVSNSAGLNITSFDVHTSTATGTAFSVDVYVTSLGGTYLGNTNNPGAWTLVSSGAGVTNSTVGVAVPVNTVDFALAPGQYGMAMRFIGSGMRYTNGNGTNQNYSNADMSLFLGAARSTTTAPFTGGTLFDPRVWNGTVYYTPVPEPGTMIALGVGASALLARRRRKVAA